MCADLQRLQRATEPAISTLPARVQASSSTQKPRRYGWRIGVALAILVCAIAAGWIIVRSLTGRGMAARGAKSGAGHSPSATMRIVPLTSLPGIAWDPAFSPDGKQIAFFWNTDNPTKSDLYVQLVGGDKPLRLTHTNSSGPFRSPAWSPDGREIAFARCNDNGGAIFVVPALGGRSASSPTSYALSETLGFPIGQRIESRLCFRIVVCQTARKASWCFLCKRERSAV
jgi:hypothetical protein